MDLHNILSELRNERKRVEEAILSLERLTLSNSKSLRGRPPKWLVDARKLAGEPEPEEPEG